MSQENGIEPDLNHVPTEKSYRDYRIIWMGQSISLLGSQIVQFAIIFWLTIESKSAFILGLATFAGLIPIVVIGPISGVLVDRWDRKNLF